MSKYIGSATTTAFTLSLGYGVPNIVNIKNEEIAIKDDENKEQSITIQTLIGTVQSQSETIQTLTETIDYYKKQIKGILEDAETMYRELEEKDKVIKFLEEEISVLHSELDVMEEKGEDQQKQIQNLFEIWGNLRSEISSLKIALKDAFRQMDDKDKEITILKQIQTAIDKDRFDLEVREKELTQSIETLREWNLLLRSANKQNAGVIGNLARRVNILRSEVDRWKENCNGGTWPTIELFE